MSSRYLSRKQVRGMLKVGDVIIPGDKLLPSFSQAQVIHHVDKMLNSLPKHDRDDFCMLMGIFFYLPKPSLVLLLKLSDHADKFPDFLATVLRLVSVGVKGAIYTLYYSDLDRPINGKSIMNTIEWSTHIDITKGDRMLDRTKLKHLENPEKTDIELIYEDARIAKKEINSISLEKRVEMIGVLKNMILERKSEIISKIQLETKKSMTDALASDIIGTLDYLSFLQKEAKKALKDETVKTPLILLGKKSKIMYDPIGTMLIISPWNYPFYQGIVPIATSFVCGNATLYKPSEYTPLKGLFEELFSKAGFDEKWVQIIYGDGSVAKNLIDKRPDKIFFTGSVSTGKKVMAQAAQQIIPVELELGGKDPALVFEDANIQRSAAGVLWGAMTTLGQSCTSVERVYVQESIFEEFKKELLRLVQSLVQKIDSQGDADVGEMTTSMQVEIVRKHVEDAKSKGAIFLTGESWDGRSGRIPPMIVENVTEDMLIATEETFGPIIPLFSFQDENDALLQANNSPYGLSASVWTGDKNKAQRVTRALEVGNVSINNVMLTEGNSYLPFGGRKLSGIGSYKGIQGIRGFCQQKSVLIDANSSKIEANWYPYTAKKYRLFSNFVDNAFSKGMISFFKFIVSGLGLESYADKIGKKGRDE